MRSGSVRREASRRWGFLLQIPLQMQQNAEPAVASAEVMVAAIWLQMQPATPIAPLLAPCPRAVRITA